jgi:hypothetical protein
MRTIVNIVVVAVMAIGLMASAALAQFNEPTIAKTVKVSIVTAYQPCGSPNTPCPAVRSDPGCGFSRGHGLMYIRTKGSTGWAIKVVLLGVADTCQNETIHFFADLRTTRPDCGGGTPCTVDSPNVEIGACTVGHTGTCGISTPVFATPSIITGTGGTEITGLRGIRQGQSTPAFTYGIVTSF